jgi:hypothetical protein
MEKTRGVANFSGNIPYEKKTINKKCDLKFNE